MMQWHVNEKRTDARSISMVAAWYEVSRGDILFVLCNPAHDIHQRDEAGWLLYHGVLFRVHVNETTLTFQTKGVSHHAMQHRQYRQVPQIAIDIGGANGVLQLLCQQARMDLRLAREVLLWMIFLALGTSERWLDCCCHHSEGHCKKVIIEWENCPNVRCSVIKYVQ